MITMCPSQPPCFAGYCDPVVGCTLEYVCPLPDGGGLDLPDGIIINTDGMPLSTDLNGQTDLAGSDIKSPVTDLLGDDLLCVPVGEIFPNCTEAGVYIGDDGGVDMIPFGHVRGGALGDGCRASPGGVEVGSAGAAFAALLLLLVRWCLGSQSRKKKRL
jgi:hypothetical protein